MADSPFAPQPEEEEGPEVYGPAAALLPQGQAAPPQQGIPYLNPADQPAPQQAPAARPQILLPTPIDPPGMTPDYLPAQAKLKADSAPVDAKANAPKWWERVAGAAVGFGTGYKDGPTAGIKAGSAVTTRGYDNAVSEQAAKVAADKSDLDQIQRTHSLDVQSYELQHQKYGDQVSQAGTQQAQQNSDRAFDRETANDTRNQGNSDREFGRATANDARGQGNSDRMFDYEKQVHGDALKQQGVQNGFEGARIGMEAAEQKRKAAKDAADSADNSPSAALLKARAAVDQTHDTALNSLEYGDPKGANDDEKAGFKANYAALGKSSGPASGLQWGPGERDTALANMLAEHEQHKQGIEASRQQQQARLGLQAPQQRAQAAPAPRPGPQLVPPQQSQQSQGAPPVGRLKSGVNTSFANGSVWTLGKDGSAQQVSVPGK